MFPLGQFVEDPQQINAGKKIPPAELIVVSRFLKTKENEKEVSWTPSVRCPNNCPNLPDSLQSILGARAPRSKGSQALKY